MSTSPRPLTTAAREALVASLQPHVAAIAEDLRRRLVEPSTPAEHAARDAANRLKSDEGSGEDLDVWLDLLGRRAAVMWVLRMVYARVLEDRRLIRPRLVDPSHQALFERLAPSLGDTAFVRWVFRDLAQGNGGLPELFNPQPAELLPPADAHTRALLALFRERDEARALRFDFTGERFDGQLMGDLYQELDPVVKERFALLQTPDFVRAFILDRTLGEALKEWPADEIRVIDPACGSGHFLIDSLRRLVDATAAQHPNWSRDHVVRSALSRVVGLDLNDYAAALARARLIMTAMELSGHDDLASAAVHHPHVYWADGLEQIERGEDSPGTQVGLGQRADDLPRSVLTPSETRARLRPLLDGGFHVVVANPPFITEQDENRKKYHKEKVGRPKRARYISAASQYSLGAPFTERCFQLARKDGFVGMINTNAFAKREFGVPLVEQVLAKEHLTLLVDTSGASIPGHGTPTLMLFARHCKPHSEHFVAVLGKRGEPKTPDVPAHGKVWRAILVGWDRIGFDSAYVSTESVDRAVFAKHPWSLRGGGALTLQASIEEASPITLRAIPGSDPADVVTIGGAVRIGADPVFMRTRAELRRAGFPDSTLSWSVTGEDVRDWGYIPREAVFCPYPRVFGYADGADFDMAILEASDRLWRWRLVLQKRATFQGDMQDAGLEWFEFMQFTSSTYRSPLGITFAEVASHNQFALDRGGKVFKQTAPVIKLPASSTEDDHLALLGPLNSSTACFWFKQVMFDKGNRGEGGGITSDTWERFYQHDSTKLARFPLPPDRERTLPWARALDALGHARADDTVAAALADTSWSTPATLSALLDTRRARDLDHLRRMVGLQEELDWLVYQLYGLVLPDLPVLPPEDTPPVTPGLRPFELDLAVRDAIVRAALARGESPDDTPTAWFERHRWQPATELPADAPPRWAELVRMRRALTARTPHLQLLEAPVHKRRWYRPEFEKDEQEGLRTWLLDRIEDALRPLGAPATPRALARRLAADPRFVAAAVVYTGAEAPDLGALAAELMVKEAVAAHPLHRYTAKGLVKRKAWEETWRLQAAEDRGEKVKIKVPPSYTGADFVGSVAYPLRGKLDVPKERFVAHTEVPTSDGKRRTGEEALYGWAGWTREDRFGRLFALLEELDDEGVPAEERVALHDLMFRYADELGRTEPARAADLRADLRGEAGNPPTEAQLQAWLKAHPATGTWGTK
jgi:hypothetical protein